MTTNSAGESRARGATEVVRFLQDHGYRHVFGLPGSSMVSVLYELQNSTVTYVPTIHESVAVAAADGYARITGSGVAMLYMVPGTANGLANLYNAWRDESPLIVLASQQASTLRTREGTVGEGDIVSMARPFTRLAQEVTAGMPGRIWLDAARRAAGGSPSGPAFLSLAEDALELDGPAPQPRISVRARGGSPDISAVVRALREAKRPCIMVGGQLRRYGGSRFVEALAERFEIPVVYEGGFNDRLGVAPGHSHSFGNVMTGGAQFDADADVAVLIGTRFMMEGHPRPTPWFANATFIAQVNADQAKLEESRTADWTAVCDPAAFAEALLAALSAAGTDPDLLRARSERLRQARAPKPALPAVGNPTLVAMAAYGKGVASLHDAMDRGWVVEECVMASQKLVAVLGAKDGERFVGCTGAALGWGTGAAIGIALATGEPVTCVLGDGALRFGAQALWTISACNLPITLVILDNAGYGSTRFFEREYVARLGAQANARPSYLNMDMRRLGPDLAEMIRGYGIACRRLSPQDDARAAVLEAWQSASKGPNAVIIPLEYEG
ncbi:MAG: thiamine pyrophosphate-binding protein [Gammaproteobacteria bacterium]